MARRGFSGQKCDGDWERVFGQSGYTMGHERTGPKSLVQVVRSEQWVAPKGDFEHGMAFRRLVNPS